MRNSCGLIADFFVELAFGVAGAGLFLWGVETISNPGFGVDIARVLWVRFYFLSQLVDENTQIFGFLSVVGPPDGL
jgi:hypothetical protein